jgi:hypothetical protein
MTAYKSDLLFGSLTGNGRVDYFVKPVDGAQLRSAVSRAMERRVRWPGGGGTHATLENHDDSLDGGILMHALMVAGFSLMLLFLSTVYATAEVTLPPESTTATSLAPVAAASFHALSGLSKPLKSQEMSDSELRRVEGGLMGANLRLSPPSPPAGPVPIPYPNTTYIRR